MPVGGHVFTKSKILLSPSASLRLQWRCLRCHLSMNSVLWPWHLSWLEVDQIYAFQVYRGWGSWNKYKDIIYGNLLPKKSPGALRTNNVLTAPDIPRSPQASSSSRDDCISCVNPSCQWNGRDVNLLVQDIWHFQDTGRTRGNTCQWEKPKEQGRNKKVEDQPCDFKLSSRSTREM